MAGLNDLEFETANHRRIYEYVERNGAVSPSEVWEHLEIDPGQFNHQIAILKRDGYLEKRDGLLRIAVEAGAEEEFTSDSIPFIVRPARQEDLSGVVGAIREVAEEKRYIVAETVAEQLDHEDALIRHNDVESRVFFVATVEGEVVAWVHLEAPEFEKLRHTAELTVGVLEEYRRHGIGSHLMRRGLEWAASNGFRKVYNSLPSTNRDGLQFLTAHDWDTEAIRTDHYWVDGQFVDEVMMAYSLSEQRHVSEA